MLKISLYAEDSMISYFLTKAFYSA